VLVFLIQVALAFDDWEKPDQYQRAMASVERVMNLWIPIAIHTGHIPLPVRSVRSELELRDVCSANGIQ